MREVELDSHTIQSHGFVLARRHLRDWLMLFFLMMLDFVLNSIHPFYRFVGKDMMIDLRYPHKSDTIPFWAVTVISVLLPVSLFFIFYYRRRDVYDLHHSIIGILFSVLITATLTDLIKDAVGRPRPDFFWRCFPDGKEVYDKGIGNVICHGDMKLIKDGHKSFPSGHTSWSFAGLSFLMLYLSGKIKLFDRHGHMAKLCIVSLPLLIACLVGVSRVDDYRHHWQDVFASGLLGYVVATLCYRQFFPSPYHIKGWAPYDSIEMMESRSPASGGRTQQDERRVGISRGNPDSGRVDDLESG